MHYMHVTKTSTVNMLRQHRRFLSAAALFISFFLFALPAAYAQKAPTLKLLEIKGNKKISTATITSKMKSRAGDPFSKNNVQEDIKSLYRIGYFDDIRVEIDSYEGGIKLIYIFTEKPTITALDIQGNEEFETDELKEKITLRPGAVANLSLITDNAKKIILFYQSEGYWLTTVTPIIREISEDAVAVTYQIDEGPEVDIDTITFEGNENISADEIEKVMQTREWWLFSFLTGSGVYREEVIRQDILRIKSLYQSKGYIYVAVSEPRVTLSPDKKDLYLILSISEGSQYRVGTFSIEGHTVFEDHELYNSVKTTPGEIFNRTQLKKDIDAIIDLYMDKGYARADVDPVIDVNEEEKTAGIRMSITEGGIFHIGRIDITGNIKTRDKVIRREMRLDEGDTFSKSRMKRSYQRINNLNYFETVDVKPTLRTEEQLMDIDVNVEEKLTGMMSIGGGYSSVDKFMVTGEITQQNLFGKGLQLKLKADFSARRTNYNISLRDPWFMDTPVSASIGFYNEQIEYFDYDKKATGGSIGFGRELSEYVGASITYRIEQVEITNASDDASDIIKDQIGSKLTSSISPSIWRDTRNNYIDTSEGSRNSLSATLAGLGGDNYFFKGVVDSMWFYPVIWDTVFMVRGRYGYASGYNGKELPLYERFYIGGINTIRGLGFGEGGPKDETGERIGGVEELIFNFELVFPIVKDIRLKGVVFFDYGGAFDDNHQLSGTTMRQTAGAGVRWISPFGPIRLEWGFNLDPLDDEGEDKLEFSLGGVF